MEIADVVMSVLVGVGLAAACGYRVFVPLLALSLGSATGAVDVSAGWEWVGSPAAIVALAVASVLEIGAYYIPAVDNALDAVAIPLATIAGTLATASVSADMPPMLRWSVAAIAGGGMALTVQSATTTVRAVTTPVTAGLGNWIVATGELVMATFSAILAIFLPVIAVLASLGIIAILLAIILRFRRKRPEKLAKNLK